MEPIAVMIHKRNISAHHPNAMLAAAYQAAASSRDRLRGPTIEKIAKQIYTSAAAVINRQSNDEKQIISAESAVQAMDPDVLAQVVDRMPVVVGDPFVTFDYGSIWIEKPGSPGTYIVSLDKLIAGLQACGRAR